MKQIFISIICSVILFALSFTFFAFIFGQEDILRWIIQGAILGAIYGIFDPLIQKWKNKHFKK